MSFIPSLVPGPVIGQRGVSDTRSQLPTGGFCFPVYLGRRTRVTRQTKGAPSPDTLEGRTVQSGLDVLISDGTGKRR